MWEFSIDRAMHDNINIVRYLDNNDINYRVYTGKNRVNYVISDNIDHSTLIDIITSIIVIDIKAKYIMDNAGISSLNSTERLLLAEMLFFDNKYEEQVLKEILSKQSVLSIDAIVNFRMEDIKANWRYLATLYERVEDNSGDILALAKYMHENVTIGTKKIYFARKDNEGIVFDLSKGTKIGNKYLADNYKDNALYTIISTHSTDLYMKRQLAIMIDTDVISNVMNIHIIE